MLTQEELEKISRKKSVEKEKIHAHIRS